MQTVLVSLSGKGKKKSSRSEFLSTLMKQFGGDAGQDAVTAFAKQDGEALKKVFITVADNISSKFSHESDSAASFEHGDKVNVKSTVSATIQHTGMGEHTVKTEEGKILTVSSKKFKNASPGDIVEVPTLLQGVVVRTGMGTVKVKLNNGNTVNVDTKLVTLRK